MVYKLTELFVNLDKTFLYVCIWRPQGHKRETVNATGCGFVSHLGKKYFIFSFSRSSNEAEPYVEFRHSTHNNSKIRWEAGNGNVLTLDYMRDIESTEKKYNIYTLKTIVSAN